MSGRSSEPPREVTHSYHMITGCEADHVVSWRGLDDHGRPVSSGAYFARLRTDEGIWSQRMMLVK